MVDGAAENTAWNALARVFGDRATRDPAHLESCAWDFGGVVRRAPAMIVEPTSIDDVLFALKIGSDHCLPIAVRGSGHSQSGQCLSERSIVIEMRRLRDIRVDDNRETVVADGGATWRCVVDKAFTRSLLPRGLTLVVDGTVAGTLSVGGVGGESFRIGPQVDNVLSMDVATLDGRVLRCASDENRELFNAVRAGLGQCGVIVRAVYPLRRGKSRLRTYFFVYDDAAACVADLVELHARPRSEHLLGFVTPASTRKGYVILLAVGKEFDREETLDDNAVRDGLRFTSELPRSDAPVWTESGIPGHLFFRLHTGGFWGGEGAPPSAIHPWVDHVFTRGAATEVLGQILSDPPAPLRMGTCGIIPIAASSSPAPLFALPGADGCFIGIGMFPNVPTILKDIAVPTMSHYSESGCTAGGKRYLSGFVDFASEAEWAEHYGPVWPWFTDMKRRYDPGGLLNPGFLRWQ